MAEKDYLLGTHDDEIRRLGLQHRVWRSHAAGTWSRAGFREGQTIVDLGCGPGFASVELAEIVGPSGRVVAIDRSRRFIERLEAERRRRELPQIEILEADLDGPLAVREADGLWCRWAAAFARDPQGLVARIRGALKTGAVVAFHEYGEYRTWRLAPECPPFDRFVDHVIRSWREDGGEPDVGRSIPGWLEASGFEVRSVRAIIEIVTPRDYMWQWPREFVRIGRTRLRDLGAIDQREADEIWREFTRTEAGPSARMITPAVMEIIARAV